MEKWRHLVGFSISAREIEYSRAVSLQLVELANHWQSDVISFERGICDPNAGSIQDAQIRNVLTG